MAIEIIEKKTICEGKCHNCKISIRCLLEDTKLDYSHIKYDTYKYPEPPERYIDCPKCNHMILVNSREIEEGKK